MGCSAAGGVAVQQDFEERYSLGKKIGEGSFGTVHVASSKRSRQQTAVKIIAIEKEEDAKCGRRLKDAISEVDIWRQVGKHQSCVSLHEAYLDLERGCFMMVMEGCWGGSVSSRLQEAPLTCEASLAALFRGMVLALRHLHGRRIVHRDVKPDNCLFGGSEWSSVKLCDFGMAAVLPPLDQGPLTGCFGTAPYMSPEMAAGSGHLASTDVWSAGATAYVILYGEFPYKPSKRTLQAVKEAVLTGIPSPSFRRSSTIGPPPSDSASEFVQTLLRRCCPQKRLTASQVLNLPFLKRDWLGRRGGAERPGSEGGSKESLCSPRLDSGPGPHLCNILTKDQETANLIATYVKAKDLQMAVHASPKVLLGREDKLASKRASPTEKHRYPDARKHPPFPLIEEAARAAAGPPAKEPDQANHHRPSHRRSLRCCPTPAVAGAQPQSPASLVSTAAAEVENRLHTISDFSNWGMDDSPPATTPPSSTPFHPRPARRRAPSK